MSRAGRAAARIALRLHPDVWRRRYGVELRDLIDETDSSLGDAADLATSALRQHLHGETPMRFEPAHRHPGPFALAALLVLAPTFAVVALSIIGHELGVIAVARAVDPLVAAIGDVRIIDLALVAAPAVAFGLAILPLAAVRIDRGDGGSALALTVRALPGNIAIALLSVVVAGVLVAHAMSEAALHAGG